MPYEIKNGKKFLGVFGYAEEMKAGPYGLTLKKDGIEYNTPWKTAVPALGLNPHKNLETQAAYHWSNRKGD